jgi:hypothetical protein
MGRVSKLLTLVLPAALFALGGCGGTKSISGKFSEPGVDPNNISVALYEMTAGGGRGTIPLGQDFTDKKGNFKLQLDDAIDLDTGHYVVVAYGSVLSRNVSGKSGQDVNPITSELAAYLDGLLAAGGTLDNLTAGVLEALLKAAADCDVNASASDIRSCFLGKEAFTEALADGLKGTTSTMASVDSFTIIGGVPDFLAGAESEGYELNFNDPEAEPPTGFSFDMNDQGAINDGYNQQQDYLSDAFDDWGYLDITGDAFSSNPTFPSRATDTESEARLEDVDNDGTGDQIVYLATTDGGLNVTRKVYVPQSFDCSLGGTITLPFCGWARYLDCFDNATGSDATITVKAYGNLGSDGDELENGDSISTDGLAKIYYWSTKDDSSDPQVGFVIASPNGTAYPSTVAWGVDASEDPYFEWADQVIADGTKACYLYYVAIGDREDPDGDIMGLLRYLYANSPRTGITTAEDRAVRNFEPNLYTIMGTAGAMPPLSTITITNLTSLATQTVTADEFGRFYGTLACQTGEIMTAVSSIGPVTASVTCP